MSTIQKEKVFVYATLEDPKVQEHVLGRVCPKVAAMLAGYEEVDEGKEYHSIVPAEGKSVHGLVLEVSSDELKKIDDWEDKYTRKTVELSDGQKAWVYIYKENQKGGLVGIEHKVFKGEVKSWDDKTLTIEHFISTETQDSGGDIMLADGMKLRGGIVVLWMHGMDPKMGAEPIAKCLGIRPGTNKAGTKGLIAKTQFYDGSKLTPPDATGQRLYEKCKLEICPNWSIGYESLIETPTQGGRIVKSWLLHEYSQVNVGMNQEATSLESSGMKFICQDGVCTSCKEGGMKPYPNEHACRLRSPIAGAETRRANADREHEGKSYDVIYQKDKDGTWVQQAFRYPKDKWSADEARAHCKAHDGILFEPASGKSFVSTEPEPDETETHTQEAGARLAAKTAVQVARKTLFVLHKAMVSELKEAAEMGDYHPNSLDNYATKTMDAYSSTIAPHVAAYLKALNLTDDDNYQGECEHETEEEKNLTESPHRIAHKALKMAHKAMLDEIHKCKGTGDYSHDAKAGEIVAAHHAVALPHAKAFVKAWVEKAAREKPAPAAPIPAPAPAAPVVPAPKTFSIVKSKAPESAPTNPAGSAGVKVKRDNPKPPPVFNVKKQTGITLTRAQADEIVASARKGMEDTIRAEINRAKGRID